MNLFRGGTWVFDCFLMAMCLVLSGCSHRYLSEKVITTHDSEQECYVDETAIIDDIAQQEAMLVNIPFPLYNERILPVSSLNISDETIFFGYKSPLTTTQAVDFFFTQMERYGWKHIVSFEGFEYILQFENPDSYCTILIRLLGNGSSIFMYIKKSERCKLAHKLALF